MRVYAEGLSHLSSLTSSLQNQTRQKRVSQNKIMASKMYILKTYIKTIFKEWKCLCKQVSLPFKTPLVDN